MIKIEVGCGSRLPGGCIGLDIVRRVGPEKPFVSGEAKFLPFRTETVDVISCSHMVEHLHPKYFIDCLQEWRRALKVGGKLVVQCPNAVVYLKELLEFFQDGGMPRKGKQDEFRGRPYELWPIINVTGLASMGDHMVNRNFFSLEHLKFYIEVHGGFKVVRSEVRRTRQTHGVEHRDNGDLIVYGVKL